MRQRNSMRKRRRIRGGQKTKQAEGAEIGAQKDREKTDRARDKANDEKERERTEEKQQG